MAQVKTESDQPELPGNDEMTDAAVLRYIASQLETLIETTEKRLDHIDTIAHDVQQQCQHLTATLEAYRPLLDKWADPGRAVRGFLTGRKAP